MTAVTAVPISERTGTAYQDQAQHKTSNRCSNISKFLSYIICTTIMSKAVSYWHTPNPRPYRWVTVPRLIDEWAEKKPDNEAYMVQMSGSPREAVTFKQLQQKTQALVAGLLQLGLKPGDFVLIIGITCMNWILTDLACASIGVHTVRYRVCTKEVLVTICARNNVKAIFYHPGEKGEFEDHLMKCAPEVFAEKIEKEKGEIIGKKGEDTPAEKTEMKVTENTIPSVQHLIKLIPSDVKNAAIDLSSLFLKAGDLNQINEIKKKVSPESIYTVFLTSGSAGFPKAVPFSHFRFYHWIRDARFEDCLNDETRFFNDRPLAWAASLTLLSLVFGNTNVHVHPRTNAPDNDVDFYRWVIDDEKITAGVLIQYIIINIMKHINCGKMKPFKFRTIFTGGEVITATVAKMMKELSDVFKIIYATTETVVIACSLLDDMENTLTYTGFVAPGFEVKIVDKNGDTVLMGQEGEVLIGSPMALAFPGCLQKEDKGMSICKDGWVHAGDVGSLHNGYLKVLGRMSDVI